MFEGLNENVVDFKLIYDENDEELVVFLVGFLNLFVNGVIGIVVGMVISILLYNVVEVIDVVLLLVDCKIILMEELLEVMLGLDFLMGGIIVELKEFIFEVYEIGCGSFWMWVKWEVEDFGCGIW